MTCDLNEYINIMEFGAAGDGAHDDADALQRALDRGGRLFLPAGIYMTGRTLHIGSETELRCAEGAVIKLMDGAMKRRGDYLLDNAGDHDITIIGGRWDGNNPGNPRGDIFDPASASGTMINFRGVRGLTLRGMTLSDPECYYLRLCEVDGFLIEDITFDTAHLRNNQDGVHLAGYCFNGVIRRLMGKPGSPNDDFIAFNADDYLLRQENYDVLCGPISHITVEDIEAPGCFTFIRLLLVESEISDVRIKSVRGGCRVHAINMDGARYCRCPILKVDDPRYSGGSGSIRDVVIEDMTVEAQGGPDQVLIPMETDCHGFEVRSFRVTGEAQAMLVRNAGKQRVLISGADMPESIGAEGCEASPDGMIKPVGAEIRLRGGFDLLRIDNI